MPRTRAKLSNSRLLIERFKSRIPQFNERRFCLADLRDICERHGIEVVQIPLRKLHGAAIEEDGYQYAYINSCLTGPEKVLAGFHEFCHLTDHALDVEAFKHTGNLWNKNKYERQANIVSALAWMPSGEVAGMSVEDLMREYGVSRRVAEFRVSLMI